MTRQMSKGKCSFCNATLGKAAMTKHLKSCKQRKAVSELEGETKSKSVQLLARNDPPSITCESCGKIATRVCAECICSGT